MVEPLRSFKGHMTDSEPQDPAIDRYEGLRGQETIQNECRLMDASFLADFNAPDAMSQAIPYSQKLPVLPVIAKIQQFKSVVQAMYG